jgi:general stress protein 26
MEYTFFMENEAAIKEQISAFLEASELCALSTMSPEGAPHVRLVYYATDPAGNLYFLSLANTRKVADMRANDKGAVVIINSDKERTLQIEGTFEEITDTATFGPIIVSLTRHLYPNAGPDAPVTHLDNAQPVCFKLHPTWIRWADFTKGMGTSHVFTELSSLA